MAILAFLLVVISGKYELAILLPKTDKAAINIVTLCLSIAMFSSIFYLIIAFILGSHIERLLNITGLTNWIWLVPIFAFLYGVYTILNEWYIRKNSLMNLSANRIIYTAGTTLMSAIYGVLKIHPGLIIGQISGLFMSIILALRRLVVEDKNLLKFVSFRKILYFAYKYKSNAKFIIPGQIINTIGGQLPFLVFTSEFGLEITGYLMLIDRIFGVPSSFIGNSFRDVFKRRAAQDYSDFGNCLKIYRKVTLTMFAISILPFTLLFLGSNYLFPIIFGEEWSQAGRYAQILCFLYFFNFLSMPTGYVFIIAGRQTLELLWQVIYLLLTIIPLFIGGFMLKDAYATAYLYCSGRCISYLVYMLMTYSVSKGNQRIKCYT